MLSSRQRQNQSRIHNTLLWFHCMPINYLECRSSRHIASKILYEMRYLTPLCFVNNISYICISVMKLFLI